MKELVKAINILLKEWNYLIFEIISIKENKKSFTIKAKTFSGLEITESINKE